jgi:hypothetical protein
MVQHQLIASLTRVRERLDKKKTQKNMHANFSPGVVFAHNCT